MGWDWYIWAKAKEVASICFLIVRTVWNCSDTANRKQILRNGQKTEFRICF